MFKIVRKEVLAENIKLMDIEAPEIAKKAQGGQFIILRPDEYGERIPLTIADFDREKGTITIIFQEVGKTTKALGLLEQGEYVKDFVGPLGEPSEVENYGTVICIGGGVGIAPIHPIARELKEAGNKVISIIGARCKDMLFWEEQMRLASDELYVCTDDGTYGEKGFVTTVLNRFLQEGKMPHKVWAIGPMPMMRAVVEVTRPFNVETIVSLNPIMVDGTGMCGACRVQVGNETKFACVDGPEFDGHKVDWELAMKRLAAFKDKEEESLMMWTKKGGGCKCR